MKVTKIVEAVDFDDAFYVLGSWTNAYRSDDVEYFCAGAFRTKKSAAAYGKRREENGQPKKFYDWTNPKHRVIQGKEKFLAAAKKVNINVNFDDIYWFE
jgi:hypothetical protein